MIELLIVFVLLQAADVWTTERGLARGLPEINPAIAWPIRRFGRRPALLGVKALLIAIAFGAWSAGWLPWPALALVDLAFAGVVVNNLLRLRR